MFLEEVDGELLSELREERNLTYVEIGKDLGLSWRQVRNACRGKATHRTAVLLAHYFGITMDEIYGIEPQIEETLPEVLGTDVDKLPPTQYLLLEVLAARYRTGENTWSFPASCKKALVALEESGCIGFKDHSVSGWYLAWLTEEGKGVMLSDTYVAPVEAE